MDEIITVTPETIPSAEIENLSNYLNNVSERTPKLHLSILPSIVSNCASVFMEYKKMKIDNTQFNKKCRIINDYLQGQNRNQKMSLQLSHKEKLREIDAYKRTRLTELAVERDISLTEIERKTSIALEEIKSNERIEIMRLKADYDIRRREQDNDLYRFQKNLKEESRRFNKQHNMAVHEQTDRHKFIEELQKTCGYLNQKIVRGKASIEEIEYSKHLMELQLMSFREGFNFTQSLCMIFSKENDN